MSDPTGHFDEAERTEDAEKAKQALEAARKLALDHDFDAAQREIEPWLPSDSERDPDKRIRKAADPKEMRRAIRKAREVHDPASVVGLKPVSKFAGPLPPPVLWMDSNKGGGTVLRAGDVALLSGAGGVGKSFASLGLALAGAVAGEGQNGEACGLHVRGGSAVLISYEDDPRTLAWRSSQIAAAAGSQGEKALDNLALIPDPEPLMDADPDKPGTAKESEQWRVVWAAVRSRSPSLVIVDPASAALAGVNQNDGGTVRRFLRELGREAEAGKFGVLVVAHSTKAARYGQNDPGPGAVAGSGQWWDAARGVLFMRGQGPKRAVIACVKANHGPVGWAVELEADMRKSPGKPDQFAGWKRLQRYSPTEWEKREKEREEAAANAKWQARAKQASEKKGKARGSRRKPKANGNGKRGPPPPNVDDI